MKISTLICAFGFLIFTGCSESSPEEAFTPPPVGILDTGEFKVILHSTPESPVYSLEDKEGNLLARNLQREQFASQFPEIYEEISSLWAGNNRGTLEADPMSRPVFEDLLLSRPKP